MKLFYSNKKTIYLGIFSIIIFFLIINRLEVSIQIKSIAVVLFGLIYYQYFPDLKTFNIKQNYLFLILLFTFFMIYSKSIS